MFDSNTQENRWKKKDTSSTTHLARQTLGFELTDKVASVRLASSQASGQVGVGLLRVKQLPRWVVGG